MMTARMRDLNTIAQWQSAEERNAIARAAIAQVMTIQESADILRNVHNVMTDLEIALIRHPESTDEISDLAETLATLAYEIKGGAS
jgi:hypothetical protein